MAAKLTVMLLWRGTKAAPLIDVICLTGGLGLAGLIMATYPLLDLHRLQPYLASAVLVVLAWLVLAVSPGIMAAWAALITAREARSDLGQLMRLATLPSGTLFGVRVRVALYRLRWLLALVAGLTPALIAGVWFLTQRWTLTPYPFFSPFPIGMRYTVWRLVVWRIDTLGWRPEFYAWVLGACGASLLGAVLGVALVQWSNRSQGAAVIGGLAMLVLMLATLLPIPLLALERLPAVPRAALVLLIAMWPLITTGGLLRLARRWP